MTPMTEPKAILRALAHSPLGAALRDAVDVEALLSAALAIQQIPAPTFAEEQRASFVVAQFERGGLADVGRDRLHNVYGRWPGADSSAPALLICAHTDTVFPAEADLSVRQDERCVHGPGLGDNSLGVAGLLALIDLWGQAGFNPGADVWFVANTREEGLGNLGGIRAVWDRLAARLGAAIVLEGMALGRIYHAGIAVRRLHVTCTAPGGHSWTHFGQPSAIHDLIAAGARIVTLQPDPHPRTTYNIGLISGGQSVNSLASHAELYLDLRSEDPVALEALERQVRDLLRSDHAESVRFEVEVVGDRPSGQIPTGHPLVQLAAAALRAIGCRARYETGSTDANALLARGLPTVTVGLTTGGNAHRLDEYIEIEPLGAGMWHVALLATAVAEQVAHWPRPGA